MRILYGVVGEGMGHAMRSRVVLEHLERCGHEVEVMASGRASEFLAKRFTEVHRIHGFHIITDENRVRRGHTLWSNILAGTTGVPRNIAAYFDLITEFRPELVISDFESWTYLYAKAHGVPVISIDNMQVINRCTLDPSVIEGHEADYQLTKAFVKGKLPFCAHYLIGAFFNAPPRKPDTTVLPPILRPEILAATPSRGDHLLVYQTAQGYDALEKALRSTGMECRVYGLRRGITEEQAEGNLRHRPFSEQGFIDDLASARGVVASAGFTLMSEAVFLRKPMLAVPLAGQFEQWVNARYLELEGFGLAAETAEDAATLARFVDAIPRCEAALARYTHDGNGAMFDALDGLLDRAASGLL
ncbi:MAG: glycosyltransferase family protein [Polyangiales bacterium]